MAEPAEVQAVVTAAVAGGVLSVVLNRPDRHNALTGEMLDALSAALRTAEKDDAVRVLTLTGAGVAFCAGFDADEARRPGRLAEFRRSLYGIAGRLNALEKPVLCAVNGTASGAGLCLALACDIRLCSAGAKLVPDFIASGLVPDGGATHRLARSLGSAVALEHAWTGKPIQPTQAEASGLVNRVVPSDELPKALRELTARLVKAPAAALGLTKRAMARALQNDFAEQSEYESRLQAILTDS
ncbi:MAG: hypothetical protein A2X36_16540 [Elusimicrobia bacterium GWA2_69_24]|nr:MAG: hypothetical protein A2X36_16540 [Elusimicrobia bacterium GWA2_69_24]HBL16343.1 hypothetical protein [Elusimicrobiota bacterium]